jgi:ABC-type phosphate/phosphonate transport system substrate-binding protein
VPLLAENIDEAASDLAAHLSAGGLDTVVESGSHARRMHLVATGHADIVWSCGWQALGFAGTSLDLVAAPTFPEENLASYRSFIIGRGPAGSLEELIAADLRWVMNEPTSWSGHRALRAECELRGLTPPARLVWSGSHAESIRMVAEGAADAAAIDSTVYRWGGVRDLAVVDVTRSWPAPPILVRRDVEGGAQRVTAQIIGAGRLRGVDALDPADWSHLDPMRRWIES